MKNVVLTLLLGLAAAAGCGTEATAPGDGPVAATVTLSSPRLDLFVSEDDSLGVAVLDEAGQPLQVGVQWSSSDATVVVIEGGRVTAVAPGDARVRALVGDLSAEADIHVAHPVPLLVPIQGEVNRDFFMTHYPAHGGEGGIATDFQCGRKAVFGHGGTDFALLDMPTMKRGVMVRAAADGVVQSVHDGEFDLNVFLDSTAVANEVVVDHGDGVRTVYSHLKKHSIQVMEGARVEAGQTLAMVGSSGISLMPHLHFELRLNDRVVDPFAGPCSGALSHWAQPMPYRDEYRLLTARVSDYQLRAPPHLILDAPPQADTIYTGRTFVAWVQELNADPRGSSIRLIDGVGSVYGEFVQLPAGGAPGLSWFSTRPFLEDDVPTGTWRMEYRYEGRLLSQTYFEVVRR